MLAKNAIEVNHLTKRYNGTVAVDNIAFQVKEGEIFGFLGPNGAGKTTTLRLLTGLTRPTSGSATVGGHDILTESVKVREHIGVVPEVSNIYDEMTAWDNLIFASQLYDVPKDQRETRAKELLELFGLYERRTSRVGTFSRGMKRRVTIATALIHKPSILFLDEPTTGLDVQSSRTIRNLIKELNKSNVTVFLTTHYIEEADQLCQRVAIINRGRIVTVSSPEKLKASAEKHQIIEVSFNQGEDLERRLANLDYVNRVTHVGDKFRLHVENTSKTISLLVDFARKNELEIVSINTLKPSLEDAFVEMTGIAPEAMATEKEQNKKGGNLS
ncbi:MAG: ATP-binding cassette domain-containing protein [Candidatus Bathyarchaeia archaeon]